MTKNKEKVLIVDDEELVNEVCAKMLEALGYEVEIAMSGAEAVEKFQKKCGEIDLVILDINMPGMGGGETFDALKEVDEGVKVIISSGYTHNRESSAILQRGCLGFLQKPFDLQSLSEKIREVLEQ